MEGLVRVWEISMTEGERVRRREARREGSLERLLGLGEEESRSRLMVVWSGGGGGGGGLLGGGAGRSR